MEGERPGERGKARGKSKGERVKGKGARPGKRRKARGKSKGERPGTGCSLWCNERWMGYSQRGEWDDAGGGMVIKMLHRVVWPRPQRSLEQYTEL